MTAIADAVEELRGVGPGDVLVFLSGEREIHDTADHLRRLDLPGTEVLPLYARLSAAEQHRIFQPRRGRRIVLSTNVAETSLTVPGVRFVVDAGTARISRYSTRLKVQRLPIEPVSQASANQRAGRCGRVAPGTCIRLYDEDDFAARPEFTEPEILRTNLAAVILQMTALGLGDVAAFPFIDPPDSRSIRDGVALLEELGALAPDAPADRRRLTRLGRRLARLPVDPRLGRMVLAADELGCAREVMVVAAALSIQDPRERPADKRQAADEAHARFATDASDFMALVRLWDHLREQQRTLSSSAFRRLCRTEYLNFLRVREWQDLFSQLRQAAGTVGIHPSTTTAHPDKVHQALLTGLLSQIGMRDGDAREYRGGRGARFLIGRESAAAKKLPRWVMAGGLVETNRLWARTVAPIQPEWAERAGAHLVSRSYGEPVWDPQRGAAVTTERVTLFGLPIVSRRVGYDRVDPAGARELFVRHALVHGEWTTQHAFVAANREVIADGRGAGRAVATRRDGRRGDAVRLLRPPGAGRRRLGPALRPVVEAGPAHLARPADADAERPDRRRRARSTRTTSRPCGTRATSRSTSPTASSRARPATGPPCTCRSPCSTASPPTASTGASPASATSSSSRWCGRCRSTSAGRSPRWPTRRRRPPRPCAGGATRPAPALPPPATRPIRRWADGWSTWSPPSSRATGRATGASRRPRPRPGAGAPAADVRRGRRSGTDAGDGWRPRRAASPARRARARGGGGERRRHRARRDHHVGRRRPAADGRVGA